MPSFDNLVALANHQERLRDARKMVWRDKGEQAVDLLDISDCAGHAGRGALSAVNTGANQGNALMISHRSRCAWILYQSES